MTTATEASEVGTRNLLDAITEGRTLPEGHDGWAIRTVRPNLRSQRGYRYPFPGSVAEAPGPIIKDNKGGCPSAVGDGICASQTWAGMASGGVTARKLLLVAYRTKDILGGGLPDKARFSRLLVVDVLDGEAIVRAGNSANLYSADLRHADLRHADLRSANLRSANLYSADLRSANLYSANLRHADLRSADLRSANLYSANLYSANLRHADLRSADLRSADLYSADLYSARGEGVIGLPPQWRVNKSGLIIPAGEGDK